METAVDVDAPHGIWIGHESERGSSVNGRKALDLDSLAVGDRFRLFNFTRRDDHVVYLWVLRAMDQLRAVHHVQVHSEQVATALAELSHAHAEVPLLDGSLRGRLDALYEDARRCGRNLHR
jgi:hypothetical protein